MKELWDAIGTLANESGGGVIPESITTQGIRGIAVFMEDGSVAVVSLEAAK